jgi:hypothetical protein
MKPKEWAVQNPYIWALVALAAFSPIVVVWAEP